MTAHTDGIRGDLCQKIKRRIRRVAAGLLEMLW